MIVVVGATAGWLAARFFTGRIADSESAEVQIPADTVKPADAGPRPAEQRIAVQPADPPTLPTTPIAPAAPVDIVASYGPALAYDLSQWTQGKGPSGFIDNAKLAGRILTAEDAATPLGRNKAIVLSGWTGDGSVGVRYPYVLISACGKIFAQAAVNLARPDVAKAVHVNLGKSGWRARIALRHVPDCENRTVRAWGVAPGGSKLILPLNGAFALSLAAAKQAIEKTAIRSAAPPLRPADMKVLSPVRLKVTAKTLNIRRCAGPKCTIVGKLAKGEWTVLTLDDSNGWLLVAMPDRAGWVSKRYIGLAQRPG